MKPITNILLLAALICYVFLPFYIYPLSGSSTGFAYTAGRISLGLGFTATVYSLLPFIACFAAIGFNCLKNRYWGVLSAACIFIGILFFAKAAHYEDVPIMHAPGVIANDEIGEGEHITGLGIGYKLSFALMCLSFISAILSVLPFEFNKRFERDFEDGKKHIIELGGKMASEITHLDHKSKGTKTEDIDDTATPPPFDHATEAATTAATAPPDLRSSEDAIYASYMPHGDGDETAQTSAPPQLPSNDNPYAAYMPHEDGDNSK